MLEEARRVPTKRASNGGVSFDTQWVIDRLQEGGWNEGQARALCDVLREIMRGVATTSELGRVESSLRGEIKGLRVEIKGVESSLGAEIKGVESSLEGQMASLRLIMLAGFGFLGVLMALLGILVTFFGV